LRPSCIRASKEYILCKSVYTRTINQLSLPVSCRVS
jgi:hypothetical protein